MPRITVSLPQNLYNSLVSLSTQHQESMSAMVNKLILAGMYQLDKLNSNQTVEQHCQQLIIQMSALIKSMSVELLKYTQNDFDLLQKATIKKHNELSNSHV